MSSNSLKKPQVNWSQFGSCIELRIQCDSQSLKKCPEVFLESKKVQFRAAADSQQQSDSYGFELNLYSAILPQKYEVRVDRNTVLLTFEKAKNEWWPRLAASSDPEYWINVDTKSHSKDPKQKKTVKKEISSIMKNYLIVYNLHQWIGFVITFLYIMRAVATGTIEKREYFPFMAYFQLVMGMEILHSLLGFGGNFHFSYLQIGGRVIVLYLSYFGKLTMHPVAIVMYSAWSLVETVRYLFYLTRLLNVNSKLITWIRYNIWIILYPLGYSCEVFVMMETARRSDFSVYTTPLGVPMHAGTLIRIFCLLVTMPGFLALLIYMKSNRSSQIKKLNAHPNQRSKFF